MSEHRGRSVAELQSMIEESSEYDVRRRLRTALRDAQKQIAPDAAPDAAPDTAPHPAPHPSSHPNVDSPLLPIGRYSPADAPVNDGGRTLVSAGQQIRRRSTAQQNSTNTRRRSSMQKRRESLSGLQTGGGGAGRRPSGARGGAPNPYGLVQDEGTLHGLLEDSTDADEKSMIRAALRKLRERKHAAVGASRRPSSTPNPARPSPVGANIRRKSASVHGQTPATATQDRAHARRPQAVTNGTQGPNEPKDPNAEKALATARLRTAIDFFRQKEEAAKSGVPVGLGVSRSQSLRIQSSPTSASGSQDFNKRSSCIINSKDGNTAPRFQQVQLTIASEEVNIPTRPQSRTNGNHTPSPSSVIAINGQDDTVLLTLEQLNKKIKALEAELSISKDFEERRVLRAKIRDSRTQIREGKYSNEIKMADSSVDGEGLSDSSCEPKSNTPPPQDVMKVTPDNSLECSVFSTDDDNNEIKTTEREIPMQDGKCKMKTTVLKSRTPSQSEFSQKETIVRKESTTPEGSSHVETNVITTKRKLTKQGSNYFERSTVSDIRIKTPSGSEIHEGEVLIEKDSASVTRDSHYTEATEVSYSTDGSTFQDNDKENNVALAIIQDNKNNDDELSPDILEALRDTCARDGESCTLSCVIRAPSGASVTWYADSRHLTPTEDFKQTFDGSHAELKIAEVFPDDEGVYKCVVTTATGMAETSANLNVKENEDLVCPEFSGPLQNLAVEEGESARLVCAVRGRPTPVIQWFKGQQLLSQSGDCHQNLTDGEAVLEIGETRVGDTGYYSCVARNPAGESRCTCSLNVFEKEISKAIHPEISQRLQDVKVKQGGSVTLTCKFKVELGDDPEVTWYKNHQVLCEKAGSRIAFNDSIAILTLAEATVEDSGNYRCSCKNDAGEVASDATVVVEPALPSGPSPPVFITALSDAVFLDGHKGELVCQLNANPKPNIFWYKNKKILRAGTEFRQTFDGRVARLVVREAFQDDSGVYDCAARNPHGKAKCSCTVIVRDENAPDTHTTATMADINQIEDEDVLHKMMNETEDFDKRKKIRARMREIREAKSAAYEKQRQDTSGGREDTIKLRLRQAEAAKQKKMQEFAEQAKGGRQDAGIVEDSVKRRHAEADAEKIKKMENFKNMAAVNAQIYNAGQSGIQAFEKEARDAGKAGFDEEAVSRSTKTEKVGDGGSTTTTTTTTTQKSQDGAATVIKKTTQVTKVGGLGGTTYNIQKAAAEDVAKQLANTFTHKGSTETSGIIHVKTENWTSRDGITKRAEKTQTWGGEGGSRVGFKQAEVKAPTAGSKPNFLGGGGGGGGVAVQRSPSNIKQMLLDWCRAMTEGYEHVDIKNFSASWNDGMAFCALIHHFHPVFDYKRLAPKNRRGNFKIAFDVAEKYADIAPLLEVDDMVRMKNPDWKCVFCYIQSFYRKFRMSSANGQSAGNTPTEETPPATPQ